ncbi:MAG: SUMF1/EgtB/PvdO family nonheme iron enzyme, partial [Paludibacter sp.]|nr:SUMF1/EgtB/PvdO family nonheme iron enzyme [Paludibacter sp.]
NLNEDAQRYWVRAQAAIKEAKNDADYLNAVEELKKALQYAPDCPDIYFNIGMLYDKSASSGLLKDISGCTQAMTYLKKYLEMKPDAKNKQEVQNKIYELEYKRDKLNEQIPEMVLVQGGTFRMGCTKEQGGDCEKDEKPDHLVAVSSFYIGKYEITQKQWQLIMGTTVSQQRDKADKNWSIKGEGDNYPMYYVSWDEAQEFINRLNAATGKQYRLPTEAEWEYASRGGLQSAHFKYSGSNNLNEVAWYADNSAGSAHPVGTKQPNELGIYDMSGNVYEWCQDWYGQYSPSQQSDPVGPSMGSNRVLRGGSWDSFAVYCRVSYRRGIPPGDRSINLGFRVVLSL